MVWGDSNEFIRAQYRFDATMLPLKGVKTKKAASAAFQNTKNQIT